MDSVSQSCNQFKVFAEDLPKAFLQAGFEIAEEPYIDYCLGGFRATYIRRYLLHQPTCNYDGILTTIIHTAGIPFGHNGNKMVILSAPRDLKNDPVSETLKLRVHIAADGSPQVVNNDWQNAKTNRAGVREPSWSSPSTSKGISEEDESTRKETRFEERFTRYQHEYMISILRKNNPFDSPYMNHVNSYRSRQFLDDLSKYVSHIIEVISPGLIQLPTDMKLEILKKLSVESIIKMSQVNNEFRLLIFRYGESLWRHLCMRDFNLKVINRLVHRTWMDLYRETYLIHQSDICRKERALPGLPERLALPPVPYRLQIEWPPEVLELPFYPMQEVLALPDNPILALEFHPLRRANSLDGE